MRYRLRTLMILVAVLPPMLAGAYWLYESLRPKPAFTITVIEYHWHEDLMMSHPAIGSKPSDGP